MRYIGIGVFVVVLLVAVAVPFVPVSPTVVKPTLDLTPKRVTIIPILPIPTPLPPAKPQAKKTQR